MCIPFLTFLNSLIFMDQPKENGYVIVILHGYQCDINIYPFEIDK